MGQMGKTTAQKEAAVWVREVKSLTRRIDAGEVWLAGQLAFAKSQLALWNEEAA